MRFWGILLLFLYERCVSSHLTEECNLKTCGKCISSTEDCAWCAQDYLPNNGTRRCLPQNSTDATWCDAKFIKSAVPVNKYTINKSFNDSIDGVKVQLKPQRIYIKARPGTRNKFKIDFHPAKDHPLDVYYLTDNSFSMRTSKVDLSNQALKIYQALTNYTDNVRLGIGVFVEKPAFPYVDQKMHTSYAFKNLLSLTVNVTEFENSIDHIQFGSNYDEPEAGLDAIMQVMICQKELGWRPKARKIIVVCTESTYHSAGDGKVIGVIKPNDMQCHLRNNMYDETISLIYDYPSVSQINYIADQEKFIIVFAVKSKATRDYIALANNIVGAKHATLEDGDSAVKIIKDAYVESADTVLLDYTFPSYIDLRLEPDCTKNTSACKSTPEQRTVTTKATIEVKYCPTDGKLKHELEVKVVGLNDKLIIDLDITCNCDCEEEAGTMSSPKCNNAGVIQCGICNCNPGSYGEGCGCNSTSGEDMKYCRKDVDDKICSGHGECRCGKCEFCDDGYSGTFCEFNDNSCPSVIKHEICSGNGICTLGRCQCDSYWSGDDCSCPLSTATCAAPYSEEICSGNGICKCGKCSCNKLEGKNETYIGQFCDTCDDCAEKRCKELEDYVACNVVNQPKFCVIKHKTNSTVVTFLNKTEINGQNWELAKWCKTQLQNDSIVFFKYKYVQNKLQLGIQNETELPNEANIYVAVGSAIGTVLLIGIITLIIWRVLINIHDKREYKKFTKEAESTGYQNVLYVPPTQNFVNPAFNNM